MRTHYAVAVFLTMFLGMLMYATPVPESIDGLTAVNRARRANGMPSVDQHKGMTIESQSHAVFMRQARRLQHSGLPYRETIGHGYRSWDAVVSHWMSSPGYRKVLLSNYKVIGLGNDGLFWVLCIK